MKEAARVGNERANDNTLALNKEKDKMFESTVTDFEAFYAVNQGFQKSVSANLLVSF
jgi:hypothetical protein